MDETLVDTSGFYAFLIKGDDAHKKAVRILREAAKAKARFVTTDYILDETATLLRARGYDHLTPELFETIFSSTACRIEWMDQERFTRTRRFFEKHEEHKWSFTDCFSFVLMKELRISKALTKDVHFNIAGFVPLLNGVGPS